MKETRQMAPWTNNRRDFLKAAGLGALAAGSHLPTAGHALAGQSSDTLPKATDDDFYVRPEELVLNFRQESAQRRLSFGNFLGSPGAWKKASRTKLAELLGFSRPTPLPARRLRTMKLGNVTIEAWVMQIDRSLSIPAYLLKPESAEHRSTAVMAIHGHGSVEPCIGLRDDYHHRFALRLAQAGRTVLCPALRGFGPLADLARGDEHACLDYWSSARGRQFTLVTDAFLHGKTLVGQTVEDLLRWEKWLVQTQRIASIDVAGISYGGDLALAYPAFSDNVRRIYSSGSLGSVSAIFSRCYNAPAHCIPGLLQWMDRSDIAGLSAPRPVRLHYGQLDVPGPRNNSASYNETVARSLVELRAIYEEFGGQGRVSLTVSTGRGHEIDLDDLLGFLRA